MKPSRILLLLGVQAALACGPAYADKWAAEGGSPIDVRSVAPGGQAPVAQGPSVASAEVVGPDAVGACASDEDLVDQRLVKLLANSPEPQAKALAAAIARATAAERATASKDGAPRAESIHESIMTLARSLK